MGWRLSTRRLRADLGIALTVRIGVNSGEVAAGDITAGHGLVAGDAVNTAARLQSAAPPGEILIGPHTRSLVGRAVRLRSHPPAQLPGKRRPLRVWQVVDLDETGGRFQRPRDVPLVGRRAELRMLRARLKRCRERRRCVLVTVTGPAGIGKSRLLREFLEAAEREAAVVVGRCLPYGDGITYWPLTQVANELAGGDGVPGIMRVLGDDSDAGTVAAQIGVVAGWHDATATATGPAVGSPPAVRGARPVEAAGRDVRRHPLGGAGDARPDRAGGRPRYRPDPYRVLEPRRAVRAKTRVGAGRRRPQCCPPGAADRRRVGAVAGTPGGPPQSARQP